MKQIIQAKFEHLNQIYSMILELAIHQKIIDRIQITEEQLGNLLFCDQPNHFVNIALQDEKICGMVMFNYTQNNICVNLTKGIYIEKLYVASQFRNQGLGKALIQYVASVAAASNCSRIEWLVLHDNKEAQIFYKNIGAVALPEWDLFKCNQAGINNLINKREYHEPICIE